MRKQKEYILRTQNSRHPRLAQVEALVPLHHQQQHLAAGLDANARECVVSGDFGRRDVG